MATAKQNFYKWHRILGLTALIPVIFWTLSGLSHPFMSNWFRPTIALEVFKPMSQSEMKPVLSIQQVLDKNNITELRNFNMVNFNSQTYYQVLGKDSVRQFDNEYGFINKRLPVEKVEYPGDENWYIETTSSKLATKVAGIDRTEGFSFIFLHKYFGMSWAGKNIRDIVSMLAALGVLVVSLFGFASFIKNK